MVLVICFVILAVTALSGGIILGVMGGSLLVGIISGVLSGSVFLGIAIIIENQQTTQSILIDIINLMPREQVIKVICEKCGNEYDDTLKSCPYCGYRES